MLHVLNIVHLAAVQNPVLCVVRRPVSNREYYGPVLPNGRLCVFLILAGRGVFNFAKQRRHRRPTLRHFAVSVRRFRDRLHFQLFAHAADPCLFGA